MPASRRGVFIVLEGPDKSGKSTQAGLLVRRLRREGRSVVHTREPGGTTFAEAVRRVVLNPDHRVAPLAELLLYEAARAQHTIEKLLPALEEGKVVVSERYTLATLAYQGFGRGLPLAQVRELNRVASCALKADATIVLDIPGSEFDTRERTRKLDRLELESLFFRRRVREGYRKLARSEKGVALLNGRLPIPELHEKIYALVRRKLPR